MGRLRRWATVDVYVEMMEVHTPHVVRRAFSASAAVCRSLLSRVVERQQIGHVRARCALWQFLEHVQQIVVWLDPAGPARQYKTVDRSAGFRTVYRIAEQP